MSGTVRFRRAGGIRVEEPRPEPTLEDLMDQALVRGGYLADIAAVLDIESSQLRRHIKKRVDSGEWRFESTKRYRRNDSIIVLAGHLIKKNQIVRHKSAKKLTRRA